MTIYPADLTPYETQILNRVTKVGLTLASRELGTSEDKLSIYKIRRRIWANDNMCHKLPRQSLEKGCSGYEVKIRFQDLEEKVDCIYRINSDSKGTNIAFVLETALH